MARVKVRGGGLRGAKTTALQKFEVSFNFCLRVALYPNKS
jgi:hypothetical protein